MKRRLMLPISLCLLGVMALVGCIPLPATHQFMTNGNLKPSWKIGSGANKPIQLHHTTIAQAMSFLNHHLAGARDNAFPIESMGDRSEQQVSDNWKKLDDHTYAIDYDARDYIVIWPLCALIAGGGNTQYLILKTDDQNIVVDYDVLSADEFRARY